MSPVAATITGAALAGLAGSPHCVGMCGGFAAAVGDRPASTLAWSLGRLSTYALLGAAAGATAGALPLPTELGLLLAFLMLLWFAASLAALPLPRLPVPSRLLAVGARVLRRGDLPSRYAFGLVTGLLPCGLVYAALSLAVATADPLAGALSMVAFGLGTLPALALATAGLRRIVAASLFRRRLLALAVLIVGVGTLLDRARIADIVAPTAGSAATQEVAGATVRR